MTDQSDDRSKESSGCFSGMPERMRNMMPIMGGSCCSCMEMMIGRMPGCCQAQTEKEGRVEEPDRDAPK